MQGVSFSLDKGEILALLGRNGAGKTSTLRAMRAPRRPELHSGEIGLDGVKLHGKPNYFAAEAGIQLVPEDRRIIPGLTVEENLQLAAGRGSRGWTLERIYSLFPRLAERRKQEGVTMSGGEQQMLAVARALARDLKLLLLDEPYEGLAPVVRHDIAKALMEIRAAGYHHHHRRAERRRGRSICPIAPSFSIRARSCSTAPPRRSWTARTCG